VKPLPVVALLAMLVLLVIVLDRRYLILSRREVTPRPSPEYQPVARTVDLRPVPGITSLARYVDVNVGDTLVAITNDPDSPRVRIASIAVDHAAYTSPRIRVALEIDGQRRDVYCGMTAPRSGGVQPTTIGHLTLAVEVTRLLFSRITTDSSPFNTYASFRLNGDLRLAVWDGRGSILSGVDGTFVVRQPSWTRERFGNWLHITSYGIHSAIDIFATTHGIPEPVLSPIHATVRRVYNRDADSDDRRRSKAINLVGNAVVGPRGERILYRFQHLSQILVRDGDSVEPGQVIGMTGHTGFNPRIGDHLHFEMRLNPSHFGLPYDDDIFASIPVNPYNYLLDWYERDHPPRARSF